MTTESLTVELQNLTIAVAVNNDKVLHQNLLRSPMVCRNKLTVLIRRDFPSASTALNSAIEGAISKKVVICAHQDVYFPNGWEVQLLTSIKELEQNRIAWAVIGVYGVSLSKRRAGRLWSSGLGREIRGDCRGLVEATSLDEVVLVINMDTGIRFDERLPAFHLYGTDIVQQARAMGMRSFIIEAPVIHNSLPIQILGIDFWRAYFYCRRKWIHKLPIETSVVPITILCGGLLKHNFLSIWQKVNLSRSTCKRHVEPADLANRLAYSKFPPGNHMYLNGS